MENEQIMTVGDVARLLGVTHRTVRGWIEDGLLTAFRLPGSGGHYRIFRSNFEAFARKNKLPLHGGQK